MKILAIIIAITALVLTFSIPQKCVDHYQAMPSCELGMMSPLVHAASHGFDTPVALFSVLILFGVGFMFFVNQDKELIRIIEHSPPSPPPKI